MWTYLVVFGLPQPVFVVASDAERADVVRCDVFAKKNALEAKFNRVIKLRHTPVVAGRKARLYVGWFV